MFGWVKGSGKRKEREAYELGRDVGATITGELEEHVRLRVLPGADRFVAVFEGQLKTIHDDPDHDAKTVAGVEWKIFQDNLDDFAGTMKAELNVQTYKWDEVLDAGGLRDVVEGYIEERIKAIVDDMKEKAAGLALAAIGETGPPGMAPKG